MDAISKNIQGARFGASDIVETKKSSKKTKKYVQQNTTEAHAQSKSISSRKVTTPLSEEKKQQLKNILPEFLSSKDCQEVIKQMEQGVGINKIRITGQSLLHLIMLDKRCENSHSIIRKLLDLGMDIDIKDAYGETSLRNVIHSGYFSSKVDLLIELGADIQGKDTYGYTILHRAIGHASMPTILMLINMGFDIEEPTRSGITCLELAISHYDSSMIEFLINKLGIEMTFPSGYTPLTYAAHLGKDISFNILLILGGILDNKDHPYCKLESPNQIKIDINAKDKFGFTALHHAAIKGNHKIVSLLIELGCDIQIKDFSGRTALQHAVDKQEKTIIDLLQKVGANDVNDPTTYVNFDSMMRAQGSDANMSSFFKNDEYDFASFDYFRKSKYYYSPFTEVLKFLKYSNYSVTVLEKSASEYLQEHGYSKSDAKKQLTEIFNNFKGDFEETVRSIKSLTEPE